MDFRIFIIKSHFLATILFFVTFKYFLTTDINDFNLNILFLLKMRIFKFIMIIEIIEFIKFIYHIVIIICFNYRNFTIDDYTKISHYKFKYCFNFINLINAYFINFY